MVMWTFQIYSFATPIQQWSVISNFNSSTGNVTKMEEKKINGVRMSTCI